MPIEPPPPPNRKFTSAQENTMDALRKHIDNALKEHHFGYDNPSVFIDIKRESVNPRMAEEVLNEYRQLGWKCSYMNDGNIVFGMEFKPDWA